MSLPYAHHLFVCTNRRPDGSPRGSCAAKGSEDVRAAFKSAVDKAGLRGLVRANAAGCLDTCEEGISVVVYGVKDPPEGVWYAHVTLADVDEIVKGHLLGGAPVERLRRPPEPAKG